MPLNPDRNLILALVAQNENQSLLKASELLANDFSRRGYQTSIFDMHAPNSGKRLLQVLKEGQVAFAFAFAGVGARFSIPDGTNLWTAAHVPFVALWHDHPSYNYRQHIVDSSYIVHCYHVLDHLEARQKHLPPSSSRSTLLSITYDMYGESYRPAWAQRNREILFAKTGSSPDAWAEAWKQQPSTLQKILWALAEQAKRDRNIDLTDAALTLFEAQRFPTNDLDTLMSVIQEVDGYVRSWRSDRLVRALLPHPAHIVGSGWDYLKSEKRRADFFDSIPTHDFLGWATHYRILANTNPLWRHGIHERTSLGMCYGAVTLTDRTIKSDYLYGGLPNYAGFEWDDDLEDVIGSALRLADDNDADYFSAAEKTLKERQPNAIDYVLQIEAAVEEVRRSAGST